MDLFHKRSLPVKPSSESVSAMMMFIYGPGRKHMLKALPPKEWKIVNRVLSRMIVDHLTLLREEDETNFQSLTLGWIEPGWANFVIDGIYCVIDTRKPNL
jgi:hypothetical protein